MKTVLIVGAGPTGLCASILLSRLGVPSLLVERHPGTSIHPKATGITPRTMEIFRPWGIEARIRGRALDVPPEASVAETLAAPEIDRRSLAESTPKDRRRLSPADAAICAQDVLEPILLDEARRFSSAEIRFATEVATLHQDADGVDARLVNRVTGDESTVRARYVIAADGAASPMRHRLGIKMAGVERVNQYISVLFHADLDAMTRSRRAALYRIEHPEIRGVLVPTSADGRWILGMPWTAEATPFETRGAGPLAALVRTAVGADVAIEVIGAQVFDIGAQVAERFRDRAIFLAGDAAHRMTPAGAMGMNSSIHDVHNLAWKIAAVVHGWADEAILDTYEAERRPVAERNVARSIGLLRDITPAAADLGAAYTSHAVAMDAALPTPAVMQDVTQPAWPGCRAPHVELMRDDRTISTLDLCDGRFVLLAGDGDDGIMWAACGWGAARELAVPFVAYTVGPRAELVDETGRWQDRFGIASDGAVLIRPDGHIAWRSAGPVSNPMAELVQVMTGVLSRDAAGARLVVAE